MPQSHNVSFCTSLRLSEAVRRQVILAKSWPDLEHAWKEGRLHKPGMQVTKFPGHVQIYRGHWKFMLVWKVSLFFSFVLSWLVSSCFVSIYYLIADLCSAALAYSHMQIHAGQSHFRLSPRSPSSPSQPNHSIHSTQEAHTSHDGEQPTAAHRQAKPKLPRSQRRASAQHHPGQCSLYATQQQRRSWMGQLCKSQTLC